MNLLKKIAGYIVSILCFLALTWSYSCFKQREYTEGLISGAIALIPLLWIFFQVKMGASRQQKEFEKWKENLKTNGVAIGVDFNRCRVKEKKQVINYTRQDVPERSLDTKLYRPDNVYEEPGIPKPSSWSREGNKVMDEKLFPDIMNQQYSYDHCICVIHYTTTFMGQHTAFVSEPILMDKASLEVQLALEKKGIIYANPHNPADYFWDIGFLFV